MQPIVATSIAPRNIEIQQIAIKSWLELGFSVTSLNLPEEVNHLSPFFREVNFLATDRSGKELYGKDYMYINDMIVYLKNHGNGLCGIINSDIIIRADSHFLRLLESEYESSLILASRWDIDALGDQGGSLFDVGFDVFFFDQNILSSFPPSKFCLGVPWWDYWTPLIAAQNGFSIKCLVSPVIYHLKHQTNYDQDLWNRVGMEFLKQYDGMLYESLLKEARNTLFPQFTPVLISILLQQSAQRFLVDTRKISQSIFYAPHPEIVR